MGQHHQAQLPAAVQNAQIANIVKVGSLILRVEFNPFQSQRGDTAELFPVAVKIRVDAAQGINPGLRSLVVHPGGGVVYMGHLVGVGGNREHQAGIYPRLGHGGPQSGGGAVGERVGVGEKLQLFYRGGGNFVRKNMGVNINNHLCVRSLWQQEKTCGMIF